MNKIGSAYLLLILAIPASILVLVSLLNSSSRKSVVMPVSSTQPKQQTFTPRPTSFNGNSVEIEARDETNKYLYSFNYAKTESDKAFLQLDPTEDKVIGIFIERYGVAVNIRIGFEGGNSPLDYIPENEEVFNSTISVGKITRFRQRNTENYIYTSYFGIGESGCHMFSTAPKACAFNSISGKNESFYINCRVTTGEVQTCDDIVESLSYSRILI